MSKVIMVEQCEKCPYCGQIGGTRYCMNDFKYIDAPALSVVELYEHETKMPDWCPLPSLPEDRPEEKNDWGHLTQKENAAMDHGWNKCLKAILKETKEVSIDFSDQMSECVEEEIKRLFQHGGLKEVEV